MTTARVQQGQARVTGSAGSAPAVASLPAVRREYGLDPSLVAQLLGVTGRTLARWEKAGKVPRAAQSRFARVSGLLTALSRVIPPGELAAWLARPNDACPSAGGRTPAELVGKGHYDKIEAMIYFFE